MYIRDGRPAGSGKTAAAQPKGNNTAISKPAGDSAKERPVKRASATKGGTTKEKTGTNPKPGKKPPVIQAMQMHDCGARSKIKTPVFKSRAETPVVSKVAKPTSKRPAPIPAPSDAPAAKKATLLQSFPKFADLPVPPAVPIQRVPPAPPAKPAAGPRAWKPPPPPPPAVLKFSPILQPPPAKVAKQDKLCAS